MPRDKDRLSPKSIERKYPHIVEITVALGGLGKRLDAMLDFHAKRGIQSRNGRRRRDKEGRDHFRWCFDDIMTATEFSTQFGGRLLVKPLMEANVPVAPDRMANRHVPNE